MMRVFSGLSIQTSAMIAVSWRGVQFDFFLVEITRDSYVSPS